MSALEAADLVAHCATTFESAGFVCLGEPFTSQVCAIGMRASTSIATGDVVIAIPLKLMATKDSLHLQNPTLHGIDRLYYWLVLERRKGTHPYVKSLSSSYRCAASHQPASDLAFSPSLQRLCSAARLEVQELHQSLRGSDPTVTKAECLWAYSVVGTRACFFQSGRSVKVYSGKSCSRETWARRFENQALVPVFDLMNHASSVGPCDSPQASHNVEAAYNKQTCCYVAVAIQPIRQGDELLLCYGTLGGLDLFSRYGFVTKDNPLDHFSEFQVDELIQIALLGDHHWHLLTSCGLGDLESNVYSIDAEGRPNFALKTLLSVASIPESALADRSFRVEALHSLLDNEVAPPAYAKQAKSSLISLVKAKLAEQLANVPQDRVLSMLHESYISILRKCLVRLEGRQRSHSKATGHS